MKTGESDSSLAGPPSAARRSAVDWAVEAGLAGEVLRELDALGAQRRRRRRLAGLAVLVIGLAAGLAWQAGWHAPRKLPAGPASVVLQAEQQVLVDGSVIDLRPGAKIAVDYSGELRRVALLKGEAHFQVAKNPARPFVVTAGTVEVRAVGTAFAVERGTATVEVLVTEGRVSVRPAAGAGSAPEPALLDAGQRVRVSAAEPGAGGWVVEPVSAEQMAEQLGWRIPMLEFSGTPLGEVVTLFNRYNADRLVLADPKLAGVRLSGVIRANNREALLSLLRANGGIVTERRSPDEIVLRPAP